MNNCPVNINADALFAMKDLLQDQFEPTIAFCLSEFDRLQQAVDQDIHVNLSEAIRHAHSLKSNAAQFGAESLALLAKQLEHTLMDGDMDLALQLAESLPAHISATKEAINSLI